MALPTREDGKIEWDARCPECRSSMDGAIGVDHDHLPKPGDVSVCLYCGTVLIFEENEMRRAAETDLSDLNEEMRRALDKAAAMCAIARRGRAD